MSDLFNPLKGFTDQRLKKEARILKLVLILKNGEARDPQRVSDVLRADLNHLARIALKQMAEILKEARRISPSEKAAREKALAIEEKEYKRRASFMKGALDLQADMKSPGLHCKAKTRCANRGFFRPKPPSPTGKTVGAFKVIRPERKD